MLDSLKKKIAQAKELLPLEQLILELGHTDRVEARLCPFHLDSRPSFSVFNYEDVTLWKCHAGCGEGDQINYIQVADECSRGDAIRKFLQMAGLEYEDNFGGGVLQ